MPNYSSFFNFPVENILGYKTGSYETRVKVSLVEGLLSLDCSIDVILAELHPHISNCLFYPHFFNFTHLTTHIFHLLFNVNKEGRILF